MAVLNYRATFKAFMDRLEGCDSFHLTVKEIYLDKRLYHADIIQRCEFRTFEIEISYGRIL